MDKKTARSIYKKIRSEISERYNKEHQASQLLLSQPEIINADLILCYCSFGTELSTAEISESLLKSRIPVAFPKCGKDGQMAFHIVNSLTELAEGSYGIPEPVTPEITTDFTEKTVCIVPGLAFTEKGERLGYGGGYYDRFLSDNPQIYTIAMTFEELIADKLPVFSHDIRVNAIITEKRMVLCSAE